MNHEGLLVSERIREIARMCDREQPIYEQISCFSIALYVFGFFPCDDLLSVDDMDHADAGSILKERFVEIGEDDIPANYDITHSSERYLLVIGNPEFPVHFAVVANMRSPQPYFSKLPFFGSGYDSLAELKSEFMGIDGLTEKEITHFKLKHPSEAKFETVSGRLLREIPTPAPSQKEEIMRIYTLRNDGNSDVLEYKYATC